MRKGFLFIFFISLISLAVTAQQPDEVLDKWANQSPIEKVYLHLDKEIYVASETIWFKAYLYSEFLPDTISTSLFVELLDDASHIVFRKIFPIIFYAAKGQIELPDSLPGGKYFIRAYSPTMLNQSPDFIYNNSIYIFSTKNKIARTTKQKEEFTRLEFFPEGGNFVAGLENTVAFKATDQDGAPVNVTGNIKDQKGETVVSFNSFHDGMGIFNITPDENEKYVATLNNDSGKTKYYLPVPATDGIVLKLTTDARGRGFEILQKKNDPIFQAAYIIGQSQHRIVFKQQFSSGIELIKGIIKTQNINSGIVQVTVFNKDNIPLAERLFFIKNQDYIQKASLVADSINFSDRGKNTFELQLQDTMTGTLSVSVTDPDFDLYPRRQENIYSDLLLTSDLKGYINDPAYYFVNVSVDIDNALDLVMMTNGWRRFKWKELLAGTIPANKYHDQSFITIRGNVKINGTKKDFANQSLMLFISSKDSSRTLQLIQTDAKGNFRLDSMIFFDYTRLLFFDVRGKKSKWVDVTADPDSLTRYYPLPALNAEQLISLKKYDSISLADNGKFFDEYDAVMRAKGITLPGITVKVRKKSPLEELEERYVSGLFASGAADKTIDLTNETIFGQNIFDYLRSRIPGLRVQENGFNYQIYYRGVNSFLYPAQMDIYLDEMLVDANIVASVPVNDIALVKVFDTFVGGSGNSPGGALAIYTKKGDDVLKNGPSQEGNRIIYKGYSVIKEFYSPDYSIDSVNRKTPDRRITLLWDPNIVVSGINPKVPIVFYNNDRCRRFRIVVEGLATSGKLVSIEKIFEPGSLKSF